MLHHNTIFRRRVDSLHDWTIQIETFTKHYNQLPYLLKNESALVNRHYFLALVTSIG